MINYIDRNFSIITSEKSLELLYEMKKFPVFIGTTSEKAEEDLFADMNWHICKESGIIQLTKLLPLNLIYSQYHSEALGNIWEKHHFMFIEFINKYSKNSVLEIGGSNGFIAKNYIQNYPSTNWTIIEPNPSFLGDKQIKVIKGFFNKNFVDSSINTIVHSHVIEHIYNPKEFLKDISEFLKEGEYQIFSIPNLKKYLQNKFTNTINFEHTFLLTEELIDYLLSIYQFEIVEKKYFNEHSIFYATKKNKQIKPKPLINHYKEYKKIYNDFVDHYKVEVEKLNNLINSFEGEIYLFGAHIFSQFLIYIGLNISRIKFILDNSKMKTNQRLYGSKLIVKSPEIIRNLDNKIAVILKAGQYQEEVKMQLKSINKNCMIWE